MTNCPICGGSGYEGLSTFSCDTAGCQNHAAKPPRLIKDAMGFTVDANSIPGLVELGGELGRSGPPIQGETYSDTLSPLLSPDIEDANKARREWVEKHDRDMAVLSGTSKFTNSDVNKRAVWRHEGKSVQCRIERPSIVGVVLIRNAGHSWWVDEKEVFLDDQCHEPEFRVGDAFEHRQKPEQAWPDASEVEWGPDPGGDPGDLVGRVNGYELATWRREELGTFGWEVLLTESGDAIARSGIELMPTMEAAKRMAVAVARTHADVVSDRANS